MKKLFLFLLFPIVLFSCSSDNDDDKELIDRLKSVIEASNTTGEKIVFTEFEHYVDNNTDYYKSLFYYTLRNKYGEEFSDTQSELYTKPFYKCRYLNKNASEKYIVVFINKDFEVVHSYIE